MVPPEQMFGVPTDIVLGIIDQASSDYATLRSCCLVSRTFSAYAQALLFRSVHLNSYRQSVAYSHTVCPSTERGRVLGGLTRSLSLSCEDVRVLRQYDRLALRDIAKLLPVVPRLHHLELVLRGTLDLAPDDLVVLSRAKSVTSLHLHNHTKFEHTVVHDILAAFPQITKLWLDGCPFRIALGRNPLEMNLSELHWHISLHPSGRELKWLLGESSEPESLSIDVPQENKMTALPETLLPLMLRRYGSNLRSLRLSDRLESLAFVDAACPRLTELLLRFWPAPETLATLPRGLTHLGLARPDERIANEPALHELMASLCPLTELKTLTWLDRNEASANERTELRRFCDARGIVVRERDCGMEAREMFPRRAFGTPVHRWITMPD